MTKEKASKSNSPERRDGPPVTHDQPIIIDGSGSDRSDSLKLSFDDDDGRGHYVEPLGAEANSLYLGVGLFISSVSVRLDPMARPGSGTPCELPFHRMCTIEVGGRRQQSQADSHINVRGRPGGIIIDVDPSQYPKISGGNTRKVHHSRLHKIRSLKIRDDITGTTRDFSDLLPENGKGIVDIIDEHILLSLGALTAQFDEQNE